MLNFSGTAVYENSHRLANLKTFEGPVFYSTKNYGYPSMGDDFTHNPKNWLYRYRSDDFNIQMRRLGLQKQSGQVKIAGKPFYVYESPGQATLRALLIQTVSQGIDGLKSVIL